jgi:hypothetical protein
MSAMNNCHCGATLNPCAGCDEPRCLRCDPYLSDDCRYVA